MATRRVLALAISVFLFPFAVFSQDNERDVPLERREVKDNMARVFNAYNRLQPFLLEKSQFVEKENEKSIVEIIDTLAGGFHRVEDVQQRYSQEPGFVATLHEMTELLSDARRRFTSGKKDYAFWRLRTISNYCVTCHTRYEVRTDFAPASLDTSNMSAFERGQYYTATRQFDKAKQAFLLASQEQGGEFSRMDALRKWLVIATRVNPDPHQSVKELTTLRRNVKLSQFEEEEVLGWLNSFRRWQNETQVKVPELRTAEHLVQQGSRLNETNASGKGTVELLRATSILHKIQEEFAPGQGRSRAYVLYLLGMAYKALPFTMIDELPELFLEDAIREAPDTDVARHAYNAYREIVTLGFTGSSGTAIPADVKRDLRELHSLSHGEGKKVTGTQAKE
jgi:hypothetical protein